MDNQKDLYIKEKLQKDKIISKKANETINKFLMEVSKMENDNKNEELKTIQNEENQNENTIPKNQKKSWKKKALVTVASLVIVLGAANVYAYTNGYDNVFFMIKTLITGEKIEGKENILSDRDISISYESINITENISIQIRNLQIKDNKAKLTIFVKEKEFEKDENIVPLNYKVYNSLNELLCEQISIKNESPNQSSYTEELELNNYKDGENILKLEIYKANSELATTLNINLQEKTVEVIGEAEALSKISETELKDFLSYAAMISKPLGQNRVKEDYLIATSIDLGNQEGKLQQEIIYNNHNEQAFAYRVQNVNEIIETVFNEKIENFNNTNLFVKKTKNGEDYYVFNEVTNENFKAECINVISISYASGIYTVQYNYFYPGPEPEEDIDINSYDIYQQTINIALNDNADFSRFRVVSIEEPSIIKNKNNTTEDNENIQNSDNTTGINTSNNTSNINNNIIVNNNVNNISTIRNELTTYLTEVNNSVVSKNITDFKIQFNKVENGNQEYKYVKEAILYKVCSIIVKAKEYDSLSYVEVCNYNSEHGNNAEKGYAIMFMYNGHQTQITANSYESDCLLFSRYDESKKDIITYKLHLNQSVLDLLRNLYEDNSYNK